MLAKANKNSMKVSSMVTMAHMVETTGMMMVSVSVGVGARVLGWTLL